MKSFLFVAMILSGISGWQNLQKKFLNLHKLKIYGIRSCSFHLAEWRIIENV